MRWQFKYSLFGIGGFDGDRNLFVLLKWLLKVTPGILSVILI